METVSASGLYFEIFLAYFMADRLLKGLKLSNAIPQWQLAFMGFDGCNECIALLDMLREDAKSTYKDIFYTFLDFTNAYGSAIQSLLIKILNKFSIPERIVSIVVSAFADNWLSFTNSSGKCIIKNLA